MTRALRLRCLIVAPLVLLVLGSTAFAKPQIAILGLEVIDKTGSPTPTDAQVAEELTTQLRARAKTSGPYILSPTGEKELIDQKLLKSCDDEKPTCMQSIGKDLLADVMMYGHIEKQNNAYQVTMFLFDVAHKTRERTYPETIPLSEASGPALAGWARKIYAKLTGQNESCIIVVKTNGVDAGTILVNGAPKGSITNGIGQVNGLTEGRYKIAVEAKDYHRWEKPDVTCSAGQTTNVPADLERMETGTPTVVGGPGTDLGQSGTESHASSHKKIWRDVAAAGVVAGLVGGGVWVYGFTKTSSYGSGTNWVFSDQSAGNPPVLSAKAPPNDGNCGTSNSALGIANSDPSTAPPMGKAWGNNAYNSACTGKKLTEVGGIITGVGAAALIVGVIMYMRSGDDEEAPVNVTAQRHRHHAPFAIVPVMSPTSGGVTFSMTW